MPSHFADDVIREHDLLRHEVLKNHDPDLEPYASMTADQILELMHEAQAAKDGRRIVMLELFLQDKVPPDHFNAMQMMDEIKRWFILRYAEEYPEVIMEGTTLLRAAAQFAAMIHGGSPPVE
jgi:hypothetical protein